MRAPDPLTVTPLGGGWYLIRRGIEQWRVAVAGPADGRWAFVDGQVIRLAVPVAPGRKRASGGSTDELMAPMPATVVAVSAAVGRRVQAGETLIVLEAMKMELPLRAPRSGVVTAVHCATGDLVQPGVPLVELG